LKKRRIIAAAAVMAVLCVGNYTYDAEGYWVDQVKTDLTLSVTYPVSVRVKIKKEESEEGVEKASQSEAKKGSENSQTRRTEENG